MANLCRLTRDIINKFCPTTDHGIKNTVYIYNKDSIDNLVFYLNELDTDTRFDKSGVVSNIISSEPFYKLYGNAITYNESFDNGSYTHTLSITINTKTYDIDDILSRVKDNTFFVVFEPKGEDMARGFGWGEGAVISSSLDITDTDGYYVITITETTDYPLFAVQKNILDLSTMVFAGTYVPDFTKNYVCMATGQDEYGNPNNTGVVLANTAPYVTSAGMPLDRNGHLCEYSGRKQACKAVNGTFYLEEYDIVGNYAPSDTVDGHPVRVYNNNICNIPIAGSLNVIPRNGVVVTNQNTVANFAIECNSKWVYVPNEGDTAVPNLTEGYGNNNQLYVSYVSKGESTLTFKNVATNVEGHLPVKCYTLSTKIKNLPIDKVGTYSIDVFHYGGFSVQMTPSTGTQIKNLRTGTDSFSFEVDKVENNEIVTFTLTNTAYSTLKCTVTVQIVAEDRAPHWVFQSSRCLTDREGKLTGYIENVYKDTNPASPSYGNTKSEKVLDKASCPTSEAVWEVFARFCEVDAKGGNTGRLTIVYIDNNPNSETYGEYSTTYRYILTECPVPSHDPQWTVVRQECQIDGNGNYTGMLLKYEEDTNPYSDSYGQQRAQLIADTTNCPTNYKFQTSRTNFDKSQTIYMGTGWERKSVYFLSEDGSNYKDFEVQSIETSENAICTFYAKGPSSEVSGCNALVAFDLALTDNHASATVVLKQKDSPMTYTIYFKTSMNKISL